MRISYFSGHVRIPSSGASSIHIMKMCSAYSLLGHKVDLFVSNIKTEFSQEEPHSFYGVQNNFEITKGYIGNNSLTQLFQLSILTPFIALLRKTDVVHSRNLASAWAAAVIFRIPVIYEMHGMPESNPKALKMFRQLVCSSNCMFIVAITELLAQDLREFIGEIKKVYVFPDGYSKNVQVRHTSMSSFKVGFKEKYGNRKTILYSGHLYEGRGIELIIELSKELSNIEFILIGGRDSDVLKFRQLTEGMPNIHFIGFVPPSQVHLYQKSADILLMPYADKVFVPGGVDTSKYASPLKMFEYMSSGVPIISSKLPILYEVLRSGSNCLMVDYSDLEGWLSGILYLLSNPKFALELSENAKRDVLKFSWENRAKGILDLLQFENN